MTPRDPNARTVRSISAVRGAAVSAGATCVFLVLGVLPGGPHWVWLALTPFMVLLTWCLWRAGIRIEADGVRVIGLIGSRSVRWEEIDRFAVAPAAGYPFIGHVFLRGGRDLWTFGLSAAGWPRSERRRLQVERPIQELNEALAEWRASASAATRAAHD
jgi:hypothetical protein